MTNKPLSKLLSVILAIAICVTTVFGCLITVNALDTTGYVITGANCAKGQTAASATVEFTATEGIAGGSFIIDNEGEWYSSVEASFSGTPNAVTDQIFVDTNMRDNKATVLFYITDETGTAKNYTAVTLKLDFVIANGGIADDIEITLSDLEITDRFEDPYTSVANNSTDPYFTAGCRHKYKVSGTKVYDQQEPEYTVYSDAVCSVCGEAKDGYQVVPCLEPYVDEVTNNNWKLLGANIEYSNDGSFALNFHYKPAYDADVKLYVVNAKEAYKSQILTEHTVSCFAGSALPEDAQMFTISNLSAKDLDILWLSTIVTTSEVGSEIVYGASEQLSVSEYAEAVIMGDAFYSEDATESEKSADKTVAAALINYSKASADALSVTSLETTATVVEKWDQYSDGVWSDWYDSSFDGKGDGTKDNPYIITSAEELAYVCKDTTVANSAGVYYKVDPSIKAFDMNTVSGVDLTDDSLTANDVKTKVGGKILGKVWHPNYTGCFAGNFDGSGVTIYGLYAGPAYYDQNSLDNNTPFGCEYGGLFGKIDPSTATIRNITFKNSYFTGKSSGAVFGTTNLSGGSAVVENVVVANCYFEATQNTAGAITGYCLCDTTNKIVDKVLINNCLVYGNTFNNKSGDTPRLIGIIENWHGTGTVDGGNSKFFNPEYFKITNTVAIGCNIEKNNYWANHVNFYSNCYTTETTGTTANTVTKLSSADDAKGIAAKTKMSALDWDTVWLYGAEGEYPSIVPADAKVNPVSVYSGIPDTTSTLSGSGTATDPYIIKTADQFAAIALGKKVYAQGSYFKVADGIKSFYMNGGETVANMTNAADVKTYFETNGGYGWTSSWDNSTADKSFSGHFDGSGVTIYGLYDADYNAGLFEMAEDSSSFKNFALKNSYIKVYSGAGVAAIVGKVSRQSDADIMTFENMVVANNHIEQTHTGTVGASAVLGYLYGTNDGVKINNSLIYGNNIVNPNPNATYGLVSVGGNGSAELTQITNVISLGVRPYTPGQGWYLRVLDGNKCFVNVYTDQDCSGMANYSEENKKTYNFKDNLDITSLQGKKAEITADALEWDSVWFADNYNDYPSLTPVGIMPQGAQSLYDGMTLENYDTYGDSTDMLGVDSTTLVLKANPYMSFIFALNDYRKYMGNGDNVTITFSDSKGNIIKSVTANDMINSESNGRYHKYYLKDIPVISLATGVTVKATANGATYNLGTYGAEGFALAVARENRLNPCDYYSTRYEAAKALVFYAQMLDARYGTNQ